MTHTAKPHSHDHTLHYKTHTHSTHPKDSKGKVTRGGHTHHTSSYKTRMAKLPEGDTHPHPFLQDSRTANHFFFDSLKKMLGKRDECLEAEYSIMIALSLKQQFIT